MKHLLFGTICIICACFFTSCNSQEESAGTEYPTELSFKQDFDKYLLAQFNAIHSNGTRAITTSEEDLYRIANILDSLSIDFYSRNQEYLASISDTITLTQEEIELMVIDEDAFTNFISSHFSPEFCQICEDYINDAANTRSTTNLYTSEMSDFEYILYQNIEVTEDYKDMLINFAENKKPISKSAKEKLCMQDLNISVSQCNKSAARSFILTIIGGAVGSIFSGGTAGLISAISLFNTANDLTNCVNHSLSDYKKCIEN